MSIVFVYLSAIKVYNVFNEIERECNHGRNTIVSGMYKMFTE